MSMTDKRVHLESLKLVRRFRLNQNQDTTEEDAQIEALEKELSDASASAAVVEPQVEVPVKKSRRSTK